MYDGLNRCNASNPAMEVVICGEVPASEPHGKVVAHAKEPEHGEVDEGNGSCTV